MDTYLLERETLLAEAACFDPAAEPFASMTDEQLSNAIDDAREAADFPAMARGILHHWARQREIGNRLELATSAFVCLDLGADPDLAGWVDDNAIGIGHQIGAGRRHFPDDQPRLDGLSMLDIVKLAEGKAASFARMVRSSPFVRKLVETSQADFDAHGFAAP